MEKNKSFIEFANGLQTMVSKYGCSFTDDELVLVKQCITKMEAAEAEQCDSKRQKVFFDVLISLGHIFSFVDHLKDWF
ncbi:hypothetical protein MTO98_16155 [Mucilaginibacter sp. SMC90]|uniref:hypothetical protein n=1 Tax=Mucilaginibacter sp. SMC90 TaxID=2929803 RepID=UPI001FB527C8|nr:hypothetical protein [Mucilaginibacter sp. SMC90]UOE52611.1 hypothetical protein MTO98_16155 [Mucilaginibacter sp. SMC90]